MQGPIGLAGPTGLQGVTGPAGLQGPRGVLGPTGVQGMTGPQGRQGLFGLPNPTVPLRAQILTGNTSGTLTGFGGSVSVALVFAGDPYPPMVDSSGGSAEPGEEWFSTTIPGLSMPVDLDAIQIPAGQYLIEAAASFPKGLNISSANLLFRLNTEPLTALQSNTVGDSTLGGENTKTMTVFLSAYFSVPAGGSTGILLCQVTRTPEQGDDAVFPILVQGCPSYFVTFVQV